MVDKQFPPSHLDQSPVEGRVPGPWEATGASTYLSGSKAGTRKQAAPKKGSRVPPPTAAQVRRRS